MLINYKKINTMDKVGHIMYLEKIIISGSSVKSKLEAKEDFDKNIKTIINELNILLNVEIGNIRDKCEACICSSCATRGYEYGCKRCFTGCNSESKNVLECEMYVKKELIEKEHLEEK